LRIRPRDRPEPAVNRWAIGFEDNAEVGYCIVYTRGLSNGGHFDVVVPADPARVSWRELMRRRRDAYAVYIHAVDETISALVNSDQLLH
jgi:hypothetical protein